jgi:cytochrome P450
VPTRPDGATEPAGPSFDPFDLDSASDPYQSYRHLREAAPVYRNPVQGFWALSRFDDVRAASRDWATFSNAGGVDLDELGQRVFGPGDFLDMDPPEHDELRAIVRTRFTPKAIGALEPAVESHVDLLLDEVAGMGTFDLMERLAWPLPESMMCSLLGCPPGDRSELGRLYRQVMERPAGQVAIPGSALEAASEMRRYFLSLARERRRRPRCDLMTEIALGRIDGRRLPEPKVMGMCFVLFSAGIDTVASLLGNALLLLAEHPAQRHLLSREPARLPAAIEEALRYDSPLQFNARTTTQPATVRDHLIPAGERVLLLYGAANRDERRFEAPERFDITREAKRHLAFGEGIHSASAPRSRGCKLA